MPVFLSSDGNSEGLFSLSSATGELRLTRDLTAQTDPIYYSLNITATDSGLPPLSTSVKVLTFLPCCLLVQFIPWIVLFPTVWNYTMKLVLARQNYAKQESECQSCASVSGTGYKLIAGTQLCCYSNCWHTTCLHPISEKKNRRSRM